MTTNNAKKKANSEASALKSANSIITVALTAFKATVQSVTQCETKLNDAGLVAMTHCANFGDIGPAERLIEGMLEHPHPLTKGMVAEVNAWFNQFSPIRFDAKGKAKLLKEGDEGFKPFDLDAASETAFNETVAAKRARAIGAATHAAALKPLDADTVINRLTGVRKTVNQATKPDANGAVKGIKKGDEELIQRILNASEAAARQAQIDYLKEQRAAA